MLSLLGYDVVAATTGEEALSLASGSNRPIDVVVTDLMMPGMSGREFADHLRRLHPLLNVVFTSGYTDDEVIRRRLVHEGQTFLQKPFTAEQLGAAIDATYMEALH
jgi:CheY-like chemotaxis protein